MSELREVYVVLEDGSVCLNLVRDMVYRAQEEKKHAVGNGIGNTVLPGAYGVSDNAMHGDGGRVGENLASLVTDNETREIATDVLARITHHAYMQSHYQLDSESQKAFCDAVIGLYGSGVETQATESNRAERTALASKSRARIKRNVLAQRVSGTQSSEQYSVVIYTAQSPTLLEKIRAEWADILPCSRIEQIRDCVQGASAEQLYARSLNLYMLAVSDSDGLICTNSAYRATASDSAGIYCARNQKSADFFDLLAAMDYEFCEVALTLPQSGQFDSVHAARRAWGRAWTHSVDQLASSRTSDISSYVALARELAGELAIERGVEFASSIETQRISDSSLASLTNTRAVRAYRASVTRETAIANLAIIDPVSYQQYESAIRERDDSRVELGEIRRQAWGYREQGFEGVNFEPLIARHKSIISRNRDIIRDFRDKVTLESKRISERRARANARTTTRRKAQLAALKATAARLSVVSCDREAELAAIALREIRASNRERVAACRARKALAQAQSQAALAIVVANNSRESSERVVVSDYASSMSA